MTPVLASLLLSFFLGWCGAEHFYLGNYIWGMAKALYFIFTVVFIVSIRRDYGWNVYPEKILVVVGGLIAFGCLWYTVDVLQMLQYYLFSN
jgi:TM2 domain-containing membrane protein YozV